ncbi:MAG: hypothetical protein ABIF40_03260 [archaeon]
MDKLRHYTKQVCKDVLPDLQSEIEDLLEIKLGYDVKISSLDKLSWVEKYFMGIKGKDVNDWKENSRFASFCVRNDEILLLNPLMVEENQIKSQLVHELGHLFSFKMNPVLNFGNLLEQTLLIPIQNPKRFHMRNSLSEGFSDYLACHLALEYYNTEEKKSATNRFSDVLAASPVMVIDGVKMINHYTIGLNYFHEMCTNTSNPIREAKTRIIRPRYDEVDHFIETYAYRF